ncbi:Superoxide dismutase [Phytophthora nicotianae]|uniref:Superoxide dismutase n=1 Tax=Phytophthora nicotianae TaxID=4792 RepID=A0A0W8D079_PHYNI|nr:Superoxide dismutase [Phytophthora nicotianae]
MNLGVFVLGALLFFMAVNANIPTIDHDEVQPFEEMEPTTDSEKSAIKYKPQLHISDGCHPYPVVQADGSVSAGLKWSGRYRSGCKGSDLGPRSILDPPGTRASGPSCTLGISQRGKSRVCVWIWSPSLLVACNRVDGQSEP